MLKKCYDCKKYLPENKFYKIIQNKSGLSCRCIDCEKIRNKEYHKVRKTKNSLSWQKIRDKRKCDLKTMAYSLYKGIYNRVHGFDRPSYKGLPYPSLADFYELALNSETLKQLMSQWKKRNYDKRYSPTVDRIINSEGYKISNIQFLTKSDNSSKK